ncbi:MAG: hypothetical protein ACREDR_35755, partial [Blastocatellia bacterium]
MAHGFLHRLIWRNTDDHARSAVTKLWSPDNRVRKTAEAEILKLGTVAIKPLIDLLSELVSDQRPRFATGREVEGNKVLEEQRRSPHMRWVALEELRRGTAVHESPEVVINSRLMKDAIRLLGQLKAVEATPLLIRIM